MFSDQSSIKPEILKQAFDHRLPPDPDITRQVSDGGASSGISGDFDSAIPGTLRQLNSPKNVGQGEGSFQIHWIALKRYNYLHPYLRNTVYSLILPILLYSGFRSDLDIASVYQLAMLLIQAVNPPLGTAIGPFMYKLKQGVADGHDPHDPSILNDHTPYVRGYLDGSGLQNYRSLNVIPDSYEVLSFHDGTPFDLSTEIQRLTSLMRSAANLPHCTLSHSSFTHCALTNVITPALANTIRPRLQVGLVGIGLCTEGTSDFKQLFGDRFSVRAVWNLSTGDASSHFCSQPLTDAIDYGPLNSWYPVKGEIDALDVLFITLSIEQCSLSAIRRAVTALSPRFVIYSVPFRRDQPHHHEALLNEFRQHGYHDESRLLSSAFFGDGVATIRRYTILSKKPFVWDPDRSSRHCCAPRPLSNYIRSIRDISPQLITGPASSLQSMISRRTLSQYQRSIAFPYCIVRNPRKTRAPLACSLSTPVFYRLTSLFDREPASTFRLGINPTTRRLHPSQCNLSMAWAFIQLMDLVVRTPGSPICTEFIVIASKPSTSSWSQLSTVSGSVFTVTVGFGSGGALEIRQQPPHHQLRTFKAIGSSFIFDSTSTYRRASSKGHLWYIYGVRSPRSSFPTHTAVKRAFYDLFEALGPMPDGHIHDVGQGEKYTLTVIEKHGLLPEHLRSSITHLLGYDNSNDCGNISGNRIYGTTGSCPSVGSGAAVRILQDRCIRFLDIAELAHLHGHTDSATIRYLLNDLSFSSATDLIAHSIPRNTLFMM